MFESIDIVGQNGQSPPIQHNVVSCLYHDEMVKIETIIIGNSQRQAVGSSKSTVTHNLKSFGFMSAKRHFSYFAIIFCEV